MVGKLGVFVPKSAQVDDTRHPGVVRGVGEISRSPAILFGECVG
jgi:hypothetical protein